MVNDFMDTGLIGNSKPIDLKGRFIYYVIKNDEVVYIGQTSSVAARMCCHMTEFNFDEFRVVEVADSLRLEDVEFMQILEHRPERNNDLPTPSFLICKARLLSLIKFELEAYGVSELGYDESIPDIVISIGIKKICYWVDRSIDDYESESVKIIDKINNLENK